MAKDTFSAQEIEQELQRRLQSQRDIEAKRQKVLREPTGDDECINCGTRFNRLTAVAGEYGLCDVCSDDYD